MIVKMEQAPNQKELEITIRYEQMSRLVSQLASAVKSFSLAVKCSSDGRDVLVNASDILYIESVDKRTFVYCGHDVYRTDLRLYQLAEELADGGFVQVSKFCVINIHMLASVRPLPNSRIEATLKSGEKVNVTRKYLAGIRAKLQER
jgi:DNA-binding LytR/AlgR family response regulator